MKRVQTHISGFDKLIENGFPQGSTILLSGIAGTGKTIFSLEFLHNGAQKDNEKCIYFTFEEKKKSLIEQAKQFGWDLESLEKENKMKIISMGVDNINKDTIDEIFEIIDNFKPKRIVIDSINTLSYLITSEKSSGNEHDIRKFIYSFLSKFKEKDDILSLLISQKDILISNTVAEYICDGVINIEYETMGGDFSRTLNIRKMRKTKNNEDIHPLEISKNGIIIHEM